LPVCGLWAVCGAFGSGLPAGGGLMSGEVKAGRPADGADGPLYGVWSRVTGLWARQAVKVLAGSHSERGGPRPEMCFRWSEVDRARLFKSQGGAERFARRLRIPEADVVRVQACPKCLGCGRVYTVVKSLT
jgi:hypothetical protein